MSRLLIASNRLPITVTGSKDHFEIRPSAGGLATAMRPLHESTDALWFGVRDDFHPRPPAEDAALNDYFREHRLVPVPVRPAIYRKYYEECSNSVIWPLFHYLPEQIPPVPRGWEAYVEVNRAFADRIAERFQPGDSIWIHDYHLMLLPRLLREKIPAARIGFFLHIPFPTWETYRTLPWREDVVRGLLGADLIGFHTPAYLRYFTRAAGALLGLETRMNTLQTRGRAVQLGVFPLGIDYESFAGGTRAPEVLERAAEVRRKNGGDFLFLGIDRLDTTKGMVRRLAAFQMFLELNPEERDRVRLLLLVAPSREKVKAYEALRRNIEEHVGHINGLFGTATHAPIQYMYQSFSQEDLIPLYKACDALLVTPLRDGMNLVSLEFAACRDDEDGTLILSEMAGAAFQLPGALLCNPYDVVRTAQTMKRALTMSGEERRRRMVSMRAFVRKHTVFDWNNDFLAQLNAVTLETGQRRPRPLADEAMIAIRERIDDAEICRLFIDFDGTLVDFTPNPELARPGPEVLETLSRLAEQARYEVHIVSGRRKEDLEERFPDLDAVLHAEHAFWCRLGPRAPWRQEGDPVPGLREWVLPSLQLATSNTPGSFIEEKSASFAWHYRRAEPEFGDRQARELKQHLTEMLANVPVEVIEGHKVIEIRPFNMNKGLALHRRRRRVPGKELRLAIGDDRTDEDIFSNLDPGDIGVHVGPQPSAATYFLPDVAACVTFLKKLADSRRGRRPDTPDALTPPAPLH